MNSRATSWVAMIAVACIPLAGSAYAIDLSGAWATDTSVCSKVFVKKDSAIAFRPESDQFGGGFIVDGNRIRGQMQTCTIKTKKDDGKTVHMIATCATDIMVSSIQFSAKIIDDNTVSRIFPGLPDELAINYSRCPM